MSHFPRHNDDLRISEEGRTSFSDLSLSDEDADEAMDIFEKGNLTSTLPDLYRLLDSLRDTTTELTSDVPPPALFGQPHQLPFYQQISEKRAEIENVTLPAYDEQFEIDVKNELLMIGQISLEEMQEKEKRLTSERIRCLEQEAEDERIFRANLAQQVTKVKLRVAEYVRCKKNEISKKEILLRQKEKILLDRLHKAFQQAESHLIRILERRKGDIVTLYGDLMLCDGFYGGSRGRRWKVDWNKAPQPIQIRFKCLRGLTDKVPRGHYILVVSICNRLGGHVLRWSKLRGQRWSAATSPLYHKGKFYNTELEVNQSVFTILPAKSSLHPSMVLLVELVLLRGEVSSIDQVVACGVFPVCDCNFDVIDGKYKCPLLRGTVNPYIDRHNQIEHMLTEDIDTWLCNLYFEAIKLPRQAHSPPASLISHKSTLPYLSSPGIRSEELITVTRSEDSSRAIDPNLPSTSSGHDSLPSPQSDSGQESLLNEIQIKNSSDKEKIKKRKVNHGYPVIGSRLICEDKDINIDDRACRTDKDTYLQAVTEAQSFTQFSDVPGVYYKVHALNRREVFSDEVSLIPIKRTVDREESAPHSYLQQLEDHTFSVHHRGVKLKSNISSTDVKLDYLQRQLFAELGLSQWRSRSFWVMIFMFMVVFFMRMLAHYGAQCVFLNLIDIPLNRLEILPYTVTLNYQSSLLYAREEMGIVVIGPLINIALFSLLMVVSWFSQKLFSSFADLGSKFILAYGVFTFLDPLLILLVDCALERYKNPGGIQPIADFAKLWWHFERVQGSGLAGVFITIFLYLLTGFLSAAVLYIYFVRLHNNGRLIDVFWRLHSEEERFFMPHDHEISHKQLCYLIRKAEQWRGADGERRKVAVYDYAIHDQVELKVSERTDVTTQVSIYTLHLNGSSELYRNFLRLPDGAIIETFGNLKLPGIMHDVTETLSDSQPVHTAQASHSFRCPDKDPHHATTDIQID